MPAPLARLGVQSLLLRQRSPSRDDNSEHGAGMSRNSLGICSSPEVWGKAATGAGSELSSLGGGHLSASFPSFFPADVTGQREIQMKQRTQQLEGTLKERAGWRWSRSGFFCFALPRWHRPSAELRSEGPRGISARRASDSSRLRVSPRPPPPPQKNFSPSSTRRARFLLRAAAIPGEGYSRSRPGWGLAFGQPVI